ncbi:T-box transcription factor TBX22, partial [Eudyptes moseleyi]
MALSSRAHAFSVEALVGRSAKRKVPDGRDEESGAGCRQSRRAPEAEKRPKAGAESREAGAGVQVELQGSELWRRFHEIGTEMIITKAGRRMFPSVRVKVKGLEPLKQYYIAIDVVPVDSKRYRYVYHSSQWMVAGNTDHSCITPRLYIHPDSPCSGETWMRQIISFDRVKLTNNEMDDKGHIILQSMHKYKPRVHVIAQDSRFDLAQIQSLPAEGVQTFSFQETEFTTVTAYQNQQITKLKIDRNPFAKGFRDPGRN